ncbi:MAG: hypothetical protein GX345_08900 [Clostridiales bacterium]|nr:hypothetical protein [Clostridiales bacterium]
MKRQIRFRLITLILTGSLLLTSTGLMTLLAQAADSEITTSQSLDQGSFYTDVEESTTEPSTEPSTEPVSEPATSEPTTGEPATSEPTTSEPTTSEPTTKAPTTSEPTTSEPTTSEPTTKVPTTSEPITEKPNIQQNETSDVVVEGGSLDQTGPEVEAEGFTPSGAQAQSFGWVGVDGTTVNMGKASNPYAVPDLEYFKAIHDLINDTQSADKYFRLTDHIDLSTVTTNDLNSLKGFEGSLLTINPALASSDPTKACLKLDGDGFKIIGFNLNNNFATNFGLFGHLGTASVLENIIFEDCAISVTYQNTTAAAVVVVQNMGTLKNLTFIGDSETVTLDMGTTAGTGTAGEETNLADNHPLKVGFAVLVADNRGTIENCDFTDISIKARHRSFIGGVAGQNSGSIKQINGSQTIPYGINGFEFEAVNHSVSVPVKEVGAIAGRNNAGGTIEDCTVNLPGSDGTNAFKLGTNVGGIAGVNKGQVEKCLVKGKNLSETALTNTNFDFILADGSMGGIVGLNEGVIDLSSVIEIGVFVSVNNSVNLGGIAGTSNGQEAGKGVVKNSFASGRHLGGFPTTLYYAGGIVGRLQGQAFLENNYALFSILKDLSGGGSGNSRGGAIVGGGAGLNSFSTTKPNYWSPHVSNMPSHAGDLGADSNNLKRSIRVLNLKADESAISVSKNDFEHSWGGTTGASVEIPALRSSSSVFAIEYIKNPDAILFNETNAALTFSTTHLLGSIALLKYDLKVELPTGVGAPGQPDIYRQMSVKLVTTASADPQSPIVSLSNPIGLSSPADTLLMRDIENTHFKLLNDITVPTGAGINSYSTIPFASTLNGDGHTLTTHTPLFSRIVGSRDDTVPASGGADSADNLERGHIYDLKVLINTDFNSGIFGNLIGGTLKNVSASASSSAKLIIDGPSLSQRGALVNNVNGYSYLYACFTDIDVDITATGVGDIAGLIGHINSPKATVESCGSNSDIYSTAALSGVASLIGTISTASQNILVKDCFAAGKVQRGGYIAIGKKATKDRVENLCWSVKDENTQNQATVLPMDPATMDSADSHQKWSFLEETGYVSTGFSYVNLPAHEELVILADSGGPGDFSLSIETANTIEIGTPSFANYKLQVPLSRHASAPDEIDTRLIAVHPATGLVARLPVVSGIGQDQDGYYLVYTPSDLKYLGDNQYFTGSRGYLYENENFKIKLMDDIDMAGVDYKPLGRQATASIDGTGTLPFRGVFDGNGKTISNLSIGENADNLHRPALIARAENALIKDLTLVNMSVTATNRFAGLVTAASRSTTFENIKMLDCRLDSNFVINNAWAHVGGISGMVGNDAINTTYIKDIEIENFDIILSGSSDTLFAGRVGGLVGFVDKAPVEIENVSAYNLNITGTAKVREVGGIVGEVAASDLAFKIKNAHLQGHETQGSEILGDRNVGGLVGRSLAGAADAYIYDASLSNYTVLNRFGGVVASSFSDASTGGIAGVFAGSLGDDPATPEEEGLLISDCTILGNVVGGILGKNDETSNNRYISITKALIRGDTKIATIDYETSDGVNHLAAGIAGALANERQNSRVQVKNAIVHESVSIDAAHYAGGIVAVTVTSTGTTYPDLEVNFLNCQSFATVTAHKDGSNAGGIIGQSGGRFVKTKIYDCVAGGTVTATNSAGGLIGVLAEAGSVNNQLEAPVFKDSYVTASIKSTGEYKGKIFGQITATAATHSNLRNRIDEVSAIVTYSSHPENIAPYGNTTVMNAPKLLDSYADFNHPDKDNPTFYIHGSDEAVHLEEANNWEEAVEIGIGAGQKMPYDFAPFDFANLDFWFDPSLGRGGWEAENDTYAEVITGSEYTVIVGAMANTSGTGVFAHYYSSKLELYTSDGAPEPLRFTARVPVRCTDVDFHWSGEGTEENPYKIISKDHLYAIRSHMHEAKDLQNNVVQEYFGGHYLLMDNLTFTEEDFDSDGSFYNEGRLFEPIIGENGEIFSGIIDGQGFTIKGLRIKASGTADAQKYVGFFRETEPYEYDYLEFEGTEDEEEVHVISTPAFRNIIFEDLEVIGDTSNTLHVGGLIGRAENTEFDEVILENATVKNGKLSAGGLVGYANRSTVTESRVLNSQITATAVKNSDFSYAGGIAGRFSGAIGEEPTAPDQYDILVSDTNVTGNFGAGGILGLAGRIGQDDEKTPNIEVSLIISHAWLEGGKIQSLEDGSAYSYHGAGGILGVSRLQSSDAYTESDDETVTIDLLHSKVQGPQIIGGAMAGGALGYAGNAVLNNNYVKLTLDDVWVNADIKSAETDGGDNKPSSAGGLVGQVENAQLIKIRNVATAGEVRSSLNLGGLLGFAEGGRLDNLHTARPRQSMVENAVIGTKIIPTRSNNMQFGLLMGDSTKIFANTGQFNYDPFVNIKFSSFVYPMDGEHTNSPNANQPAGHNITGDGSNQTFALLTKHIKDLNKGLTDGDYDGDYAGLLFDTGEQTVNTLILGSGSIDLTLEKPVIPGDYSIKPGGDFTDFEDQTGLSFKLKEIFTLDGNKNPRSLAIPTYDDLTGKWSVLIDQDGIGYLICRYENGLDLAINLIAYEDLEGDGSQTTPYKISRTGHFDLLRYMTTAYFEQVNDIAFTEADFEPGGEYYNDGAFFTPIKGFAANVYFSGHYDGGGYSIDNLKVKQDENDESGAGLFARLIGPINRARIINLTLNNVDIEGGKYVGGIVGFVDTDCTGPSLPPLQDCHVKGGQVESLNFGTGGTPEAFAGGIAGSVKTSANITGSPGKITDKEINDCSVQGLTITAVHTGLIAARYQNKFAGGIAAEATYVINCTVDSTLITAGGGAGGLVGRLLEHTSDKNISGRITNSHVSQDYTPTIIKLSEVNSTATTGGAGGLLGVHNANTDLLISGSTVDQGVRVEALHTGNIGAAGGLVGSYRGGSNRNKQKLEIDKSVSQAHVKARIEAGGILGTLRGEDDDFLPGKLTIKDSVGALRVESTRNTTYSRVSAGGIIGTIMSDNASRPFQLPGALPHEMIVGCIAGGELVTHTNNPYKGKLVGNMGDGLVSWTQSSRPNLFKNNIISSFPQDLPLFGGPTIGSLNDDQGILAGLVAHDIATYTLTTPEGSQEIESFMVQNTVDGVPQGDEARPIAMAPFDENNITTTHFISTVNIKTSDGSVKDLVKNYPLNLTQHHQINIDGMRLQNAAASTEFDHNFDGSGQARELRFEVTPHQNTSGYVLVELSYGLALAVPLVAFEIKGNGSPTNPFEIEEPLHLSLLYYLTDVHYKQMNDLILEPEHFMKNAYPGEKPGEFRDGELYWNIQGLTGFRPVGTRENPFTGTYDGQGKKIKGFYSVYGTSDYVGMFGYIAGQAQLKNIHLELAENKGAAGIENQGGVYGKEFVGGLVAYSMSSQPIVNCSVVGSQVVGQWKVGGLVGGGRASLEGCFTVTDVFAYASTGLRGFSGGLYGQLENTTTGQIHIKNSFAAGNIYSTREKAGGFVGHVPTNNGGILVEDSFFTGSVSTEYTAANRAVLFGQGGVGVSGTITADRLIIAAPNIDYIKNTVPIVAQGTTTNATNVYFDNSLLGSDQTALTGQTASTTAALTGEELPSGFSAPTWSAQAGSYPRLKMMDDYSDAYCALATVPLLVDEKDTEMENGMFYTPSVLKEVDGQEITFSSSVLDLSDTKPYPEGYDPNLYGNGTNRQVDILFEDEADRILIYRNIFKNDKHPTGAGGLLHVPELNNHRFFYKFNNPILGLSAQIDGVDVKRQIFLPFRKADTGIFIATERQLRALSTESPDRDSGKFSHFASAINSDTAKVWLSADIDLRSVDFEPISYFKGEFRGNSFSVKNMTINKPNDIKVGMFKSLESTTGAGYIELRDIILENVQVEGKSEVGALVGFAKGVTGYGARILGCSVFGDEDSFVKGTEIVGGLVGKMEGGVIDTQTRSAVNVSGYNIVGGLVGDSTANIANSFFTGKVTAEIDYGNELSDSGAGIGGLIGLMKGGSVNFCFSSGDVSVTGANIQENMPRSYGVGGAIGILESGSVENSFSSGLVDVLNVGNIKNTGGLIINFGVGGFAGISKNSFTLCYSSSAVSAEFAGEVLGTSGSFVAAGVGGVVGIALHQLSDSYSSGSVLRDILQPQTYNAFTYFMDNPATANIDESAIGGVIGTNANSSNRSHSHLYFDKWNNSIDNLLVVGGEADTINIKSLTTPELTISYTERMEEGNPLTLSDNLWSFNKGAYPAINQLVNPNVTPLILYPAVLSIVALTPDDRDLSAKDGQGISMALTTTDEIEVLGVIYPLEWKAAEDSPVAFILQDFAGGSKLIPVRTSNRSQFLNLIVYVEEKEEYGTRAFGRACAEMLGTVEKPYLVSHKMDLQHIGLIPDDNTALSEDFKDFYKTWYSPIDENFENIEGKVHFRLLADIDMQLDVEFALDEFGQLRATVNYDGDSDLTNDRHYIGNIAAAQYGDISFAGISFDGRDYAVKNFNTDREFIFGISNQSEVMDVAFENLTINSQGTDEEDNGTALVRHNNTGGLLDGIMIRSGSVKGGDLVAGLVANNLGTLINSTVAADIEGRQYVGGLAAKNLAGGTIETSAYVSGSVVSTQDLGEDAIAGGLVGQNGGFIENSFSLGSVDAQEGADTVGGLVAVNTATGEIEAAHTRTKVSGGDLIGGFAGANAGSIKYAYSAGRVKPTNLTDQEGIFVAKDQGGELSDAFADKNLAGSDTYNILADASLTEDVISLKCFHENCPTKDKFVKANGGDPAVQPDAYPQLKAILELDDEYVMAGDYIPLKHRLLIAYSRLGSATIITKYSQYVDTLALSSANPLSAFSTGEAYLNNLSWDTSDASVITAAGATGAAPGTATLTAKLVLDLGDGLHDDLLLDIEVETGKQNPNFDGGDGSEDRPYEIDSVESFNSLAYYGPGKDNNYILTDDLDYADHDNETGTAPPVAIESFMGKLDGGKHVIKDLTIDNNSALFGYAGEGAVIKNLGLLGAKNNTADTMHGEEDDPDAKTYTALLVGKAEGAEIRNSYAVGEIRSDADFVGGLVAYAGPGTKLESVITSGKFVSSNSDENALIGGLVGVLEGADASLTDGFSTAYVQGVNETTIGGLVAIIDNGATIDESVYAGMVVDEKLADGGRRPDEATNIGNIAGFVGEDATIEDCEFDKQISLVSDENAAAKFSAELSYDWLYDTGFDDQGASDEFITGLEFATTLIDYSLGSSAGSTANFLELSFPRRVNGEELGLSEEPQNTEIYLDRTNTDPFTYIIDGPVAPDDIYAGVNIMLELPLENQPYRYARPRINRVIEISYTLHNDTGEMGMSSENVIVSIKNVHYFGGKPANFGADIFTNANATASEIDDAVVSSGGIFALGSLPAGYKYMVTAQDQDGNYLLGSALDKVEVKETEGGYGAYIELEAATEEVVIHYYIVKDEPWGVYIMWSSLIDNLK